MPTLITYKIVSDRNGKLKQAGIVACNFWNKFINPKTSIVIKLGVFTSNSSVIASSYKPYNYNGVSYGRIEFNTEFLDRYNENKIIGTIIHEIGHTLGFGWDKWMTLFNKRTGKFNQEYINELPELANMRVETDYGQGTTLAHWDEEKHDKELMTGIKDTYEFVLPITIDVTKLLGHEVIERLVDKTPLSALIDDLKNVQFLRVEDAKKIDRDYFEATEIWERTFDSTSKNNKKSHFIGEVSTKWLQHEGDDRNMRLLEDFIFIDANNTKWIASKNHKINGANIPEIVWSTVGSPFVGDYRRASVIHDVECCFKRKPHKEVHKMFYEAMLCDGVSIFKAKYMYQAVRIFGPKWDKNRFLKNSISGVGSFDLAILNQNLDLDIDRLETHLDNMLAE